MHCSDAPALLASLPSWSSSKPTLLENHENQLKLWQTMKLTWKQTKNHDKPWRYLENLESQQRTMKTHETTTKKTWNYPENYETTLKNHENQSRIMKNCKNILKKHENTLSNFRDSHGLGALFNGLTSAVVPQNWQISGVHADTLFVVAKMIIFRDRHTQAVRTSIEYRSPPSSSSSWKLGCQAVRK